MPLGFDTQLLKRHNYLAAFKTSHFLAHTALGPYCTGPIVYSKNTSHFLAHTALGPYCTGPYVTSCKIWDVKNHMVFSQIMHSKSQEKAPLGGHFLASHTAPLYSGP